MKRILVILFVLILGGLAFGRASPYRDFKFIYSGVPDINYPCPRHNRNCIHSGWHFEDAVAGAYVNDYGAGTYSLTVNGAPTRVNDGTYPFAGGLVTGTEGMAWEFDGAADFLSRADDGSFDMDLVNNPGGDFSVQCVVTTDLSASGRVLAKWNPGANQRGWMIATWNNGDLRFYLSEDGIVADSVIRAGAIAAHRPSFVTVTYQYVASGSSIGNIYVDNLATTTDNTLDGPVHNSTADFTIGAEHGGVNKFIGSIHDCKIWKGIVITENEHDEMFARWRGIASTATPNVYVTTTSASPPAIPMSAPTSGTEPFLTDQPSNAMYIGVPAANSGGLYGASDLTSKWWRGSCESAAGADCNGWIHADNQGAGAGVITADRTTTTSAHGGASVLITSDGGGAPKHAYADGACQVNWIGQDVSLIVWGITTVGAANCVVQLLEYDTAVCGTLLATNTLWGAGSPGANWTQLEGTLAAGVWNVATSSWQPRLRCDDNGAAFAAAFDAAMALQSPTTFHTSAVCVTDAAADAVCNDTIHSIASPLSANGQFTIQGTWRSPWAGTDLAADAPLFVDGVPPAANTYGLAVSATTDEPYWLNEDATPLPRYNGPNVANWAADTDYTVYAKSGGNNDLGLYWNAAWDLTEIGAGTGTRQAAQATSYVGTDNAAGFDVWTHSLMFYGRQLVVVP